MSLSVVLHMNEGTKPNYFFEINGTEQDDEKFQRMVKLFEHGPCCLGHGALSSDAKKYHVSMVRTHYVGDIDVSQLGGNGERPDDFQVLDLGSIQSFKDDESGDHITVNYTMNGVAKTAQLPIGDRHAPMIDGIYATLKVATALFQNVTFAVSKDASWFFTNLSGALDATMQDLISLDYDPTYCYSSRLAEAVSQLEGQEANMSVYDADATSTGRAIDNACPDVTKNIKVTTYDGKIVLSKLEEVYVNKPDRKPLYEIYNVAKATFLSYYTPLDEILQRCNKFLATMKPMPADPTPPAPSKKQNNKENHSYQPYFVIGAVALLALVGIAYLYRTSRSRA